MNKRNAAAAAAAANGEQEGTSPPTADDATGSGRFSMPSNTTAGVGERIRNPFADYDDDDDDENSGSGSDDGEVENVEGEGAASSSGWERGSWWRGVVRSARRAGAGKPGQGGDVEVERFGDGRDDDSSDEEGGSRRINLDEEEDGEDEEFGDFAMPEVEERGHTAAGVSGIDPARESVLVKPTALHPSVLKSSAISPFSSLWPFSTREKSGGEAGAEGSAGAASSSGHITEEPVELTREEEEAMISEDGKRIDRAVEATRRTSIEDPDEDEVDVGEEVVVRRGAGGR